MTDYAADLMRLHQRFRAIAEEFGDVPDLRLELARAKQELARAFAMFDRWRQLREGLCATRDDHSQLY